MSEIVWSLVKQFERQVREVADLERANRDQPLRAPSITELRRANQRRAELRRQLTEVA